MRVDDNIRKFCERQANNNLDIVWPLDEQSIVIIFEMTVADDELLQRYRDAVKQVIDTLYYEDEGESKVKIAIVESDYESNSGPFGNSEGLISLSSEDELDSIKSEIEDASEYDSIVDFTASLEEAQEIFDDDTADNKSVFIISDGLTDDPGMNRNLVPAAVPDVHYFTSNHIPIHVIRVKDHDETFDDIRLHEKGKDVLQAIVSEYVPFWTSSFADGIKMRQTYVDDDLGEKVLANIYDIEVSKIMLDILAGTNAYKKVPVMTVRVPPPPLISTETRVVTISPLAESAKFSLDWVFTLGGLRGFILEQPDGVIIDPTYAASMDSITYYERESFADYGYPIRQYASYNVKSPIPGEWKAHFAGDEDFNFEVAVESRLQVDVAAGPEVAPQPTTLTSTVFPEPIPILAHVEGVGTAVVHLDVAAEVTMPDASTATLVLMDDGSGSDEVADDGRYSGVLTDYSQDGTYHIKVTVKNDSGEAQFMELNEFATEPSTPTQVPKFQREGYTQVQVTGTDKTFGSQQDPEDIIPDGTLYWGMVKQSNPINWYGFIAIEGSQYFIQTSNLLGADNTEMMTNVNLYEAGGSALIDTSIGIPGDGVSSIEWTAPTSDYYLVSVAHANQGAGNYALSVSERDRMPQRSGGGGSMDYPLLLLLMLMLAFIIMKNIFLKKLTKTVKKHSVKPLLILGLSITVILLQGCGAHRENPTIEISIGEKYDGYAVSAERRLVLAKGDSICAEPSPDAAQALLSLFSLSGSLGGTAAGNMSAGTATQQRETGGQAGADAGVNARAAMSELIQTTPFQLFNRSQGVQFYRDSIQALCQMTMNEW
ncbi:MAG: hypothetical protein F4Y58_01635, partial [Gammaproteobacteria bacterium]|nr:hypothetical protein [Gammaproteobacteria bacterium]